MSPSLKAAAVTDADTINIAYPPDDLLIRIGVSTAHFPTRGTREQFFGEIGRAIHQCIRNVIPHQDGQRILDFGCGSGRVLRWFVSEPDILLTGCDIDHPSIAWMQDNFPSAVRLYVNEPTPPLPEADDTFDLIYCGSVFSHLTEWAPWLLELRRVLKPGGALVASLHGRGFWGEGLHGRRGIPWNEDDTGMLIEHYGDTFEDSWGPAVYVSEWWVREHWGRALDIELFEPTGFGMQDNPTVGQAWILARKPAVARAMTPHDLEVPSADVRETNAALRGRQLAYEEVGYLAGHLRTTVAEKEALSSQVADLNRRLSIVENSRSWRLTRPLRSIARQARHKSSELRLPNKSVGLV